MSARRESRWVSPGRLTRITRSEKATNHIIVLFCSTLYSCRQEENPLRNGGCSVILFSTKDRIYSEKLRLWGGIHNPFTGQPLSQQKSSLQRIIDDSLKPGQLGSTALKSKAKGILMYYSEVHKMLRLFADTKRREDLPQKIFGAECASNLSKSRVG